VHHGMLLNISVTLVAEKLARSGAFPSHQ